MAWPTVLMYLTLKHDRDKCETASVTLIDTELLSYSRAVLYVWYVTKAC